MSEIIQVLCRVCDSPPPFGPKKISDTWEVVSYCGYCLTPKIIRCKYCGRKIGEHRGCKSLSSGKGSSTIGSHVHVSQRMTKKPFKTVQEIVDDWY